MKRCFFLFSSISFFQHHHRFFSGMIISKSEFPEVLKFFKFGAFPTSLSVLILCASDVDSICALHILSVCSLFSFNPHLALSNNFLLSHFNSLFFNENAFNTESSQYTPEKTLRNQMRNFRELWNSEQSF